MTSKCSKQSQNNNKMLACAAHFKKGGGIVNSKGGNRGKRRGMKANVVLFLWVWVTLFYLVENNIQAPLLCC